MSPNRISAYRQLLTSEYSTKAGSAVLKIGVKKQLKWLSKMADLQPLWCGLQRSESTFVIVDGREAHQFPYRSPA